jgi:hypothetical protein
VYAAYIKISGTRLSLFVIWSTTKHHMHRTRHVGDAAIFTTPQQPPRIHTAEKHTGWPSFTDSDVKMKVCSERARIAAEVQQ